MGANTFDVAVWGEMIEHAAYPERILAEIRRVLKPQGWLILSTPNGERFRTGLPTFSQVKDRAPLEQHQFKPDGDGHLFLFERSELATILAAAGFSVRAHQYYASPWTSGRLGFRYWMSWMPAGMRARMEGWTLAAGPIVRKLTEGQVVLAVNDPK